MSEFNATLRAVKFAEAVTLLKHEGQNTSFLFRGRPGIGKSTLLTALFEGADSLAGTHNPVYVDCANMDLGDLAMPRMSDAHASEFGFAVNARFKLSQGKPVVIMLDELGKADRGVLNMLLPLVLERRIGDVKLPEGSIVFATTNLKVDNVGDMLHGHATSRLCDLELSTPSVSEWQLWAVEHNIAPELIAFVQAFPQVFADARDPAQRDNPFIYVPGHPVQSVNYACPRTLAACSNALKLHSQGVYENSLTLRRISGSIGDATGSQLMAYARESMHIPTPQDVLAGDTRRLGSNIKASMIFASSAVLWIADNLTARRDDVTTLIDWIFAQGNVCAEARTLFTQLASRTSRTLVLNITNPHLKAATREANQLSRDL